MKRWTIQTTAGILLSVLTFQNCKFVQGGPQQETTGSSEPTSLSRQFAKSDRPVFAYYKGDGRGKDLPGFWRANSYIDLLDANGRQPVNGWPQDTLVLDGQTYIGGSMTPAGGKENDDWEAGVWKNEKWIPMENGHQGQVNLVHQANGRIIAAGDAVYGSKAGLWIDQKKIALNTQDAQVLFRHVFGNGQKTFALVSISNRVGETVSGYWNLIDGTFVRLPRNFEPRSGAVFQDEVYIVGNSLVNGKRQAGYLKGMSFQALSDSMEVLESIAFIDSDIYVSGRRLSPIAAPSNASATPLANVPSSNGGYWKNGVWNAVQFACANSSVDRVGTNQGRFYFQGKCDENRFYSLGGQVTQIEGMANGTNAFFTGGMIELDDQSGSPQPDNNLSFASQLTLPAEVVDPLSTQSFDTACTNPARTDNELRVVGVYEADPTGGSGEGSVTIEVAPGVRKTTLVLSSYNSVQWNITGNTAAIDQIIMSSYDRSKVSGVDPARVVAFSFADQGYYFGSAYDFTVQSDQLTFFLSKISQVTCQTQIRSSQGVYNATSVGSRFVLSE